MLHTMITKRLEIRIDVNIEISEVDHYTWIFISRIFKLALEITSYSHKVEKLITSGVLIRAGGWKILKK